MKAADLARKNSEATRALAMKEEILENELGEIQKVLLAMQVNASHLRSILLLTHFKPPSVDIPLG